MKWILLAFRNVCRNIRRSLMAGGIVAMGTSALVISIGFALASFHGLRETTIHGEVGHIQIALKGGFESDSTVFEGLSEDMQKEIEEKVKEIPEIRFTMARVLFDGLVTNGERTVAMVARGVDPAKEMRMSTVFAPVVEGEPLNTDLDGYEALVGVSLAKTLNAKPGDLLTIVSTMEDGGINAIDVTVSGLYRTGVPDKDARNVMLQIKSAQGLLGATRVSRIIVVLKDTKDTDQVTARLQKLFPNLSIRSWMELDPFYVQVVTLYTNIFSVISVIIIIVVLLSVVNTMLMTVMERVREVGTLRAIGFSKQQLRTGFALEGAIIGMIGAFVGLIIAIGTSFGINLMDIYMPPPPGRTTPYPLIIFIDFAVCSYVMFAMVICGLFGAWLPATSVVRKQIVEALGHD